MALQLKKHFPAAFAVYTEHCQRHSPTELFGTCLLVAPQHADYNKSQKPVWVACLFTSVGYGKRRGGKRSGGNPGVSSRQDVLQATGTALGEMLEAWQDARADAEAEAEADVEPEADADNANDNNAKDKKKDDKEEKAKKPGAIFSPRFNAGSFGVPWEATEELILQKWSGVDVTWTVVSR